MNEQRYRSTAGPALASMDNWNAQQNRRPVMLTDSERAAVPEPDADAVERVHKAICGALVMMGYSPIEFVVDGTMTAMARAALQAAAVEPEPGLSLDAVEAMLLSDDVVVAAGDVIADEFYADLPMMTGEAYSRVAKAALQAALAAAKGTEGSE